MTQAITVGFAPAGAPAPGLATPAAAAGHSAGHGSLFAALLALLAPGFDPAALTEEARAGLSELQAKVPTEGQQRLNALAGKLGIDLAALGHGSVIEDGVTDIVAEAPRPDPEALGTAIDRLMALLGPAAATEDDASPPLPETVELEEARDALLAALDAAPPTQPSTADDFARAVGEITEAIAGPQPAGQPATTLPTSPTLATPAAAAQTGPAAAAPAGELSATPLSAAAPATIPERSPALHKLVRVFEDAARRLEAGNPQLAGKLAELARALPALPDDVIAALDERPPAAAMELEAGLERLVDRLVADGRAVTPPRPQPVPPAFAQPLLAVAPAGEEDGAPDEGPDLAGRPALRSVPAEEPHSPPPAASRADPVRPAANEGPARPTPAAQTTPVDGAGLAEELQPTAQSSSVAAAPPTAAPAALRAVQAAYQPPAPGVVIPQVAFEIARQFDAGNSRFQIRLDPPELGRIDVRLDMDRGGNINARLTVERPETLDLMQRDQRALHQALQQAGLDSSRANLEFSLRQNPFAGEGFDQGHQQGRTGRGNGPASADTGSEPVPEIYRGAASAGALNLFV